MGVTVLSPFRESKSIGFEISAHWFKINIVHIYNTTKIIIVSNPYQKNGSLANLWLLKTKSVSNILMINQINKKNYNIGLLLVREVFCTIHPAIEPANIRPIVLYAFRCTSWGKISHRDIIARRDSKNILIIDIVLSILLVVFSSIHKNMESIQLIRKVDKNNIQQV